MDYQLTETATVIRLADSALIPDDSENADRQQYLQWLADGNTPKPVDQPTPLQVRERTNAEARAYLAATDWYVVRALSGKAVPEFVIHARQAARDRVI